MWACQPSSKTLVISSGRGPMLQAAMFILACSGDDAPMMICNEAEEWRVTGGCMWLAPRGEAALGGEGPHARRERRRAWLPRKRAWLSSLAALAHLIALASVQGRVVRHPAVRSVRHRGVVLLAQHLERLDGVEELLFPVALAVLLAPHAADVEAPLVRERKAGARCQRPGARGVNGLGREASTACSARRGGARRLVVLCRRSFCAARRSVHPLPLSRCFWRTFFGLVFRLVAAGEDTAGQGVVGVKRHVETPQRGKELALDLGVEEGGGSHSAALQGQQPGGARHLVPRAAGTTRLRKKKQGQGRR